MVVTEPETILRAASEIRAAVDRDLSLFVPAASQPQTLALAMRHGLLAPAKRVRSIMLVLTTELFGDRPAAAIRAASAIELVHAASLILDDLPAMDDAALRRGRETTHRAFGESTAILAAIALLNAGYEALVRLESVSDARKTRAIAFLTDAVGPRGLSGGQLMDLNPEPKSSLSTIETVHRGKTGALFAAALGIGATISAPDLQSGEAYSEIGMTVGLAFQGYDDLLDAYASSGSTGKDVKADGKKLTIAGALGRAGGEEWARQKLESGLRILAEYGHERSMLAGYIRGLAEFLTRPLREDREPQRKEA